MPWKALFMDERDGNLRALPCCANWISRNYGSIGNDTSVEDLWNSSGAQEIRHLMATGRYQEMCAPSCPWLNSGRFGEDQLSVIPGPPEFEENQRLNNEEIRQRKTVLKSRPMALRVIPTLRCNIRCRMCHQDHLKDLHIPEVFHSGAHDLAPYLYDFQLHGGEVLISRDFPRWVDPQLFDAYPQMKLSLITNATSLLPQTREVLERVRINYITVSINAASRQTYAYMAEADLFDKVINNVIYLRDLGRNHPKENFQVYISFVIMRCNYHEVTDFVRLANKLALPFRLLLVVGDRLGESIYTQPPILDSVLAAVNEAEAYARADSIGEIRVIQAALRDSIQSLEGGQNGWSV
jgi:hypothetical protein